MDLITEKPFMMALAAPRESGKSYLISKCLEAQWVKRFNHIFILSPSIHLNGDYDQFDKYEHVHLIEAITPSMVDDIFRKMVKVQRQCKQRDKEIEKGYELPHMKCPETLLILDDCIDSSILNFKGAVDKIAERGRHANVSCVVSSQRLSAISLSIRINCNIFIIFIPYQAREFEKFIEQFIFRDQRTLIYEEMRKIFDIPYRFLFIDNTVKNMREKLKTSSADDFIKNKFETLDIGFIGFDEGTGKRKRQKSEFIENKKSKRNSSEEY